LLDCSHYVRPAGINHQSWTFTAPPDWQRKRLRSLCKVNPSATTKLRTMAGSTEVSFLPMELARAGSPELAPRTAALSDVRNGFTPFIDGDLLIAKITPCFENGKGGIADNLLNGIGFGSTEFHVLRPGPEMDVRFLYYATISEPFREIGVRMMRGSAGQQRVPVEFLNDFVMVFPDIRTQRLIAEFLDRYMRLTGSLIRAKRRQIELLNEQKQVIINWAVTRGLNPNTPLKQSGIYWLDEIPAHWNLRKLKCLVDITSGQVDPRVEPYRRQVLVAPNHVESGTGRITYEETAADQGADSGKYLVQEGQIIYSKIRPNLRKAAVALRDCLCSADMYPLSPNELELRTEFLLTLLLSDPFTRYALDCSMRVAMPKINRDALRQCWLWYPSLSEQDEILRALSTEIAPLDTLVYAARRQIDLFREYRTRLIADVVTGKLDVRGVELPDLEGADIADDLGDSDFGSDTDQDDLPDAEEVEADDED